jgi:hypothetical protein
LDGAKNAIWQDFQFAVAFLSETPNVISGAVMGQADRYLQVYRNLANRGHFPFVGRVSRRLRIHKTLYET